jgi:predicted N-acetyltransferase YhbS
VSDAYILDVVVDPAHRSQGVGRTIVKRLAEHLASFGIDWIVCVGVPGTEAFYRAAGAASMDCHTPFRFGGKS